MSATSKFRSPDNTYLTRNHYHPGAVLPQRAYLGSLQIKDGDFDKTYEVYLDSSSGIPRVEMCTEGESISTSMQVLEQTGALCHLGREKEKLLRKISDKQSVTNDIVDNLADDDLVLLATQLRSQEARRLVAKTLRKRLAGRDGP